MYLLNNISKETFDSYIKYSLRDDKRLWNRINENIQSRNGKELPIESRMIKSILSNCKTAGIDINEVDEDNRAPWGNKSIFHRAKDLGIEYAHADLFSGQSHVIHGNWNDLIFYHLKKNDNYFKPNFNWNNVRPQGIIVNCLLSIDALIMYVKKLYPQIEQTVLDKLLNLQNRLLVLDKLHEEYLNSKKT